MKKIGLILVLILVFCFCIGYAEAQTHFVPLDIYIYPLNDDGQRPYDPTPYLNPGQPFDLVSDIFIQSTDGNGFWINDIVVLISNLSSTRIYHRQIFAIMNGGQGCWITVVNIIPPGNLWPGRVYKLTIKYRGLDPNGIAFIKSQSTKFMVLWE